MNYIQCEHCRRSETYASSCYVEGRRGGIYWKPICYDCQKITTDWTQYKYWVYTKLELLEMGIGEPYEYVGIHIKRQVKQLKRELFERLTAINSPIAYLYENPELNIIQAIQGSRRYYEDHMRSKPQPQPKDNRDPLMQGIFPRNQVFTHNNMEQW